MKKRWRLFATLCFMFTALVFFAVAPRASADSLQDQINALKAEVAKLEGQQMELKKQATEAAAALPNFSYRAGSGILMEAADKSWSLRLSNRFHYWWLFREGDDDIRVGTGELFARRIRPTFNYCVNNCFYETEVSFDLDSQDAVSLQRAATFIHLEQVNPWLPTFYFGIDSPTAWARRRSSSSGAQLDYDILSRSNGFNTGSQGWNYGLLWEDKPLGSIGIPGKIEWFTFVVGAGPGAASDGGFRFSDKKDYVVSLAVSPFSELKSKWIRGLELSWGAWFCNFDPDAASNGCAEARIRETDGPVRANIWRHFINSGESGMHHFVQTSARWRVGPYQLLASLGFQRYEDTPVEHRNFFIGHELYVWSPKGFLTGSSSTPGSILIGTHFERSDGRCREGGRDFCRSVGGGASGNTGNNHLMLTSASIYYVIQRGLHVGVHWNHYDAKKLGAVVKDELDISGTSWDNVFLIFRWEY